jgi:predicted glycogen debranching enzyme
VIDEREWLEPDGLGGYAMSTVSGIRTRRYHAILCAATRPPDGRVVLVADLEVHAHVAAGTFALSAHRYRGDVVHPDGATRLLRFYWRPHPRWEWTLPDGTTIACELAVAPGTPRVAIRWTRLAGTGPLQLAVRPLLACRDFHSTHHENGAFRFDADVHGQRVAWQPYGDLPRITALANAQYDHSPDWYRAFVLACDRERGLDFEEDLATPGTLTFDLAAAPAALVLSAGDGPDEDPVGLVDRTLAAERVRRAAYPSELARAADAYIVARGTGRTVIAGYPWFGDWGRDTFISLRGLCLATGRRELAGAILDQWASAVSEGMLPNRYDEHDFNSVDAALWFVIAADAYGPTPAHRRAIDQIVDGYSRGTRFGIGMDPTDGLLACGVPGIQLTWMDAKVGDDVITPRTGKPVEIQALWVNALAIAGDHGAAQRAIDSFAEKFWDPTRGQLHDVVDCPAPPFGGAAGRAQVAASGPIDATCRPNQLFAIGGLPYALLAGDRARLVVDTCERELWTPAGPRSLATDDPRYHGRFTGGPHERDRVYHNGPVWPWLAGAFVDAWLRVRGDSPDARHEARRRFVEPLLARLEIAGLGHLSEICEGDPPHRPVGCPFQAWSVAELLRIDLATAAPS